MTTAAEKRALKEQEAQASSVATGEETEAAMEGQSGVDAVTPVLSAEQMAELSVEQIDALIKSAKTARKGVSKGEAEKEYAGLVEGAIANLLLAAEKVNGKRVKVLDLRVKYDGETDAYVVTKNTLRMSIKSVPAAPEGDAEDSTESAPDGEGDPVQ